MLIFLAREMAIGNTFAATALSSFGGFWLSFAILETPGGFEIVSAYGVDFNSAFGFYLIGWFIFTTILLLCTLRSTVAFFLLFFFLDMTFLLLAVAQFAALDGVANVPVTKAAGYFGLFAALMSWYNALAGLADVRCVYSPWATSIQLLTPISNSFFLIPVAHFPWSEQGRKERQENQSSLSRSSSASSEKV